MSITKKKRRVSGEGPTKQTTIKDMFSKQQQKPSLPNLKAILEVQHQPNLVLEIFLEEALKVHETYKEQQGAASRAIDAASGLRRSNRRRSGNRKFSDDFGSAWAPAPARARRPSGCDEDGGGSGSDEDRDGGEGPAGGDGVDDDREEAEDALNSAICARWQGLASSFLQQVSKWASPNWMLPLALQECLVHFVANHELHTTDPGLSVRALRLLQQIAAYHPHAAFLPADDDLPARVSTHEELWHPLVKASTLTGRMGATGFQLLQRLLTGTLELAAGAGGACSGSSGGAAGEAGPPGDAAAQHIGRQGRALLLHYLAGVLQSDLAARLRVWREARALDNGGARAAETVLQNALLWRLLQDDNSWNNIRGDKVHLVRNLALLAVAGRASQPGLTSPMGRQRHGAARGAGEDGAAQLPVPALLRPESLRALGARLLRLLLALLGAAEEAGLYSEKVRSRAQGKNDRAQLDMALKGLLLGNDVPPELKHPISKGEVLALLPGRDRVRLISIIVAEAYNRSWKDKHPCDHLERMYTYVADEGKGTAAFMAGDAKAVISYLTEHYAWAAKALVAGSLAGCTVVASQLVLGAAEQVEAQAAAAAAAAAAAGGAAAARWVAGTTSAACGRKGGARGAGGQGTPGSATSAAASAAAFPIAEARALLSAARGADGYGALQVDVKEALALAEAAAERLAAGGEGDRMKE